MSTNLRKITQVVRVGAEDDPYTHDFTPDQMLEWLEDGTLLTIAQAAAYRGVTRQAINDLCRRGRIRYIQLEHGKLLWSEELRNLIFHKPGRPRSTPSQNANRKLETARRRKPIPPPDKPVPLRDIVAVLEREVVQRTIAYPGKVASNRMPLKEAISELAGMKEALKVVRARMIAAGEKPQRLGFYREPVNSLRDPRLKPVTRQGKEVKRRRRRPRKMS